MQNLSNEIHVKREIVNRRIILRRSIRIRGLIFSRYLSVHAYRGFEKTKMIHNLPLEAILTCMCHLRVVCL
jgi:hypothetical protein